MKEGVVMEQIAMNDAAGKLLAKLLAQLIKTANLFGEQLCISFSDLWCEALTFTAPPKYSTMCLAF